VKQIFKRLNLNERFYFVRDLLMLPSAIEKIPIESNNDDEEYKYENNLNEEECQQYYYSIKDSLCELPYAPSMIFHIF
jgi:hypothetical protein